LRSPKKNVSLGIQDLKYNSGILAEMVHNGEIKIIGGIYDINTGLVEFIDKEDV
jgi:carbonic anhydrase